MRSATLVSRTRTTIDALSRAVGAVRRSDARALELLYAHPLPSWSTRCLRVVSHLGDGWLWAASAVVLAAGGPHEQRTLAAGATAAAITNLCLVATKRRVRRERPPSRVARIAPPDPFSFPSGHTANAFALCTVLATGFPAGASLLGLLAVGIGISRVLLGVHYPSDVLAGGGLGAGAAALSLDLFPF